MLHSWGVHPWSKTTALSQCLVFLKGEEGKDFDYKAPPSKHESCLASDSYIRVHGVKLPTCMDSDFHQYCVPRSFFCCVLRNHFFFNSLSHPSILGPVECLSQYVSTELPQGPTLPLPNSAEEELLMSVLQAYSLKWFHSFFFPTCSPVENRQKSNSFHSLQNTEWDIIKCCHSNHATLSL